MLHWTVLNEFDVWMNPEDQSKAPKYKELERDGATLVVQPLENGKGRLERLISPRASDYLKPEWQPGSIVSMQ